MSGTVTAQINGAVIQLKQGDITQEAVDAIVNAANTSLLGGGGVDGAIHRAAGSGLLAETRMMGGCDVGDAKISGGYNLPATHVIHTVGPVYEPTYNPDAPEKLASAYQRSLEVAAENHLVSVAFPAISTGVYRYPLAAAAQVALETTISFLAGPDTRGTVAEVRFVLFTRDAYEAFWKALKGFAVRTTDLHLPSSEG